jgi:hypothetical protein
VAPSPFGWRGIPTSVRWKGCDATRPLRKRAWNQREHRLLRVERQIALNGQF